MINSQDKKIKLPLSYQKLVPIKYEFYYKHAISKFYNTDCYEVNNFYKPIAKI